MRETYEYRPPFAKHVVGTIEKPETDPKTKFPEDQKIVMLCEKCKDKIQRTCSTGHTHGHVQRFAILHLHRDPLDPIPGVAPGMPEP